MTYRERIETLGKVRRLLVALGEHYSEAIAAAEAAEDGEALEVAKVVSGYLDDARGLVGDALTYIGGAEWPEPNASTGGDR